MKTKIVRRCWIYVEVLKYYCCMINWRTKKNQRYYSNHEHEKSKKNYTKSPYKYQRRPMHSKSNEYIYNYLIGNTHYWKM